MSMTAMLFGYIHLGMCAAEFNKKKKKQQHDDDNDNYK